MPSIVAIDGPAGAGKSTVARRVAGALGFTYVDTGAMYRAVAWKAARTGVDPSDTEAQERLAASLAVAFSPLTPDGRQCVFVDGEDVTAAIRTPEVSGLTSTISANPAVRRIIVASQRAIAQQAAPGAVLEGRDIGTVVFPDATVKVFMTASAGERARRRYNELDAQGMEVDYERILAEQNERDDRDSRRATSPLMAAPDALVLDTDGLTVEEVVDRILELCREKLLPPPDSA